MARSPHCAAHELCVKENGRSFSNEPGEDGRIHDQRRIDYLEDHFAATVRAVEHGAPLVGYIVWSQLDNTEWAHGYSQRFGIVRVDSETGERFPRESALWYRQFIAGDTKR